jgi:hypothetical protein
MTKYATPYQGGTLSVVDNIIVVTTSSIITPSTMGALRLNRPAT